MKDIKKHQTEVQQIIEGFHKLRRSESGQSLKNLSRHSDDEDLAKLAFYADNKISEAVDVLRTLGYALMLKASHESDEGEVA